MPTTPGYFRIGPATDTKGNRVSRSDSVPAGFSTCRKSCRELRPAVSAVSRPSAAGLRPDAGSNMPKAPPVPNA